MSESLEQLNERLSKLNKTIDQHLDAPSHGTGAWIAFVVCLIVFAVFAGWVLSNNGTLLQWCFAVAGFIIAISIMLWRRS